MSAAVVAQPLFEPPAARTLDELHDELAAAVLQRVEAGVCGCGCGEALPSKRGGNGRQRYLAGHRQRAHRRRLELEAKLLGVVPRLSLQALKATVSTDERHGDAETGAQAPQRRRRRPRPGVSVYLPSVELAERLEEFLVATLDGGVDVAEDELEPARVALERAVARARKRTRAA